MPNRTEILHFRATPEEKGRIKENAGHAELHLSEWMRQRSLDRLIPAQFPDGPTSEEMGLHGLTQPAVEENTTGSPALDRATDFALGDAETPE